jgi:hypothetical protein
MTQPYSHNRHWLAGHTIDANVRFVEIDLNIRICSELPLPALPNQAISGP